MDPARGRRAAAIDAAEVYATKRAEFTTLALGLASDQLETQLAATPDWRVRDALAHVAGITADLNAGNFGNRSDPEAWTTTQVENRRLRTIEEIVAEWEHESPTFEGGLRAFGYELGSHYVADLHAHLQDVRAALGLARDDDELTVVIALDFYLDSLNTALRDSAIGAVVVVAGSERHVVGGDQPVATVTAAPFEILRSLSGRRSLRQIGDLDWTGDVVRLAPALSRYPLPAADITD